MLNEHEQILYLEAENKKLKMIIQHLDSRNKKYLEYMEKLQVEVKKVEIKDFDPGSLEENFITYETIRMPEMRIGYRSLKQDMINIIQEAISNR